MATLELNGVVKRFDDTPIIHGADLSVGDGELVVFVGPSGCGKSTLLRMIAGLETLSDGQVVINGERIDHRPPSERGIAMVFQSYALYPHKDVRGNLGFALKHAGVDKIEIARRVDEAAAILGLESMMERRPRELSGGQRQRVAIGRAIVREPDVFLFDEPLSNLDAALRVHMRVEILKLHQRLGATMVYVTHDQVEAMTLADRIVVLRAGRIEQIGSPLQLYREPDNTFVAGFIGSPAMNLLDVTVDQGRLQLAGQPIDEIDTPPEASTLGLRPEHLRVCDAGTGLTGQVVVAEHLGGEAIVHLALPDGQVVVAKLDGDAELRPGDALSLTLRDNGARHLFDVKGLRLRTP